MFSPKICNVGFLSLYAATLFMRFATASYVLSKTYDQTNFFDSFAFRDFPDPTKGFVTYVDKATALSAGLAKIVNGKVYLGADNTTVLSPQGPGRRSVRLESIDTFNNGLLVGDFDHMPGNACGIWPSFWTLNNAAKPTYGEIDIVEGVALQNYNDISMYTGAKCNMEVGSRQVTSINPRKNCTLSTTGASGCGVTNAAGTFGDEFNAHGGGVWALQLESDAVRIFFFPRAEIPADLASGNPNPAGWGNAVLDFEPSNCDIAEAWSVLEIVFNITFCGESAGGDKPWSVWTNCKAKTGVYTCEDYVAQNPAVFDEAYFLINSVKLFQQQYL
ncbi:glycoside hydrolase family 16 protein [Glonium stellatum]|uniref:Glycoside hydrolase family 16 protein n=1 Tax=Glonium stellatum TaxID=574774 RepID=A0A8E2JSS9_9PEZI|nr:glycoside hydrolase family 16 protein [Glonium stellatum]